MEDYKDKCPGLSLERAHFSGSQAHVGQVIEKPEHSEKVLSARRKGWGYFHCGGGTWLSFEGCSEFLQKEWQAKNETTC